MARDSFTWLHLTDLHWGLDGQGCLGPTLRGPFFEDLEKVLERTGPVDAVLFTGDLVQSGESEQFEALKEGFLDRLWAELGAPGSGEAPAATTASSCATPSAPSASGGRTRPVARRSARVHYRAISPAP
jgi:3',5'-cyclic AMP phosphodiesterase CpdA